MNAPFEMGITQKKLVAINTETSYVNILGTTNINEFNCSYEASLPKEEFQVTLLRKEGVIEVQHEALFLKVVSFKCPNSEMTKDFHDLLRYTDYPFIIFKVQKIIDNKIAEIMIEMAGEQKTYQIKIENDQDENSLICNTTMQICITDFGLEAPEKFFGMVKVNDTITVDFKIDMHIYDN